MTVEGLTVGVFGSDGEAKAAFEGAVSKRSEAEGVAVHTRVDAGRRYSFLDTSDYPQRIQGYSRVASLADHALYLYPKGGKLAAPDGELAVLLGAFGVPGTIEILDGTATPEGALSSLKGTAVGAYRVEERDSQSSSIDLSYVQPSPAFPQKGTMVYIDRAFTVKGVGTVALGFVLSGTVSIHDQLRPVPGPSDLRADVKGIQVNDVDMDSAGRGIRVGLSLRGVEPEDLERSHWLDDGSFPLADSLQVQVSRSPFYKQEIGGKGLHLQLPGELVPTSFEPGTSGVTAKLPWQVPAWEGMRGAVVDLNGGSLRVAGGATFKL